MQSLPSGGQATAGPVSPTGMPGRTLGRCVSLTANVSPAQFVARRNFGNLEAYTRGVPAAKAAGLIPIWMGSCAAVTARMFSSLAFGPRDANWLPLALADLTRIDKGRLRMFMLSRCGLDALWRTAPAPRGEDHNEPD